jgi:hypothetical protein
MYDYLESVIAVYVLGRCLGKVIANQLHMAKSRSKYSIRITRVVTATLFVHVFAAGLVPEPWTVLLRLVTAILAGMLCGMTSIASLGEVIVHAVWNVSAATKTYWIGFLTSVVLTSFIRANQAIFRTPLALAGIALAAKLVFSPVVLTTAVIGAEIILRFLFAFTPNNSHQQQVHHHPHSPSSTSTAIPRHISTRRALQPGHNRILTSNTTDINTFNTHLHNKRREGTSASKISRNTGGGRISRSSNSKMLDNNRKQSKRILQSQSLPANPSSLSSQRPRRQHHHATTNPDAHSNGSYSSLESSERAASPPQSSYESEICLYRNHQCVYADGTPAYVPQGDCIDIVPTNFLEFYNHDHTRARRAWEATQEWRRTHNVWKIHTLPNRWFPRIKEAYPHYVHGHSKAGFPIVYEQPGRMRLKELFRSGCEIDDMIFHYQFLMEFFSNIICTRDDVRSSRSSSTTASNSTHNGDGSTWGLMVVMDVQGFGLNNLSKDVLTYLQRAGEVNKSHYPLCTKRAFVVKTPYFLAGCWSGLKTLLPESVQVDILSESKYANALREFIDDDQIPREYGGSSPYRLGEHPYELSLKALVEERLTAASEVTSAQH